MKIFQFLMTLLLLIALASKLLASQEGVLASREFYAAAGPLNDEALPIPARLITYHSSVSPTRSDGQYLGYDAKEVIMQVGANVAAKGYRFIVSSDAEEIYWYVGSQSTGAPVDPRNSPHSIGYFVHEQKDLRNSGRRYYPEQQAPVIVNGAGGGERATEIEFVPIAAGQATIFCVGVTAGHFWVTGWAIRVLELDAEEFSGEAEFAVPEITHSKTMTVPNVAFAKMKHAFVGDDSSVVSILRNGFNSWGRFFGAPHIDYDFFLGSIHSGQAAFGAANPGVLLSGAVARNRVWQRVAVVNSSSTQQEFTQGMQISAISGSSLPGSIRLGGQINREYSFGTEDGNYQRPHQASSFAYDDMLSNDDRGYSNHRLDSADVDLSGFIESDERVDGWQEREEKVGIATIHDKFYAHEDWDFSGDDREAVQSFEAAITVVRANILSRYGAEESDTQIPAHKRLKLDCLIPDNSNDNNLNGIGDFQEDVALTDAGVSDYVHLDIELIPSFSQLEALELRIGGQFKLQVEGELSEHFALRDAAFARGRIQEELSLPFVTSDEGFYIESGLMGSVALLYGVVEFLQFGTEYESSPEQNISDYGDTPSEENGEVLALRSIGIDVLSTPEYLFLGARHATPVKYAVGGLSHEHSWDIEAVSLFFCKGLDLLDYADLSERTGSASGCEWPFDNSVFTSYCRTAQLPQAPSGFIGESLENYRMIVCPRLSVNRKGGVGHFGLCSDVLDEEASPSHTYSREFAVVDLSPVGAHQDFEINPSVGRGISSFEAAGVQKHFQRLQGANHFEEIPNPALAINGLSSAVTYETPLGFPMGVSSHTSLAEFDNPVETGGNEYQSKSVGRTFGNRLWVSYGGKDCSLLDNGEFAMDLSADQGLLSINYMPSANVTITNVCPHGGGTGLQSALSGARSGLVLLSLIPHTSIFFRVYAVITALVANAQPVTPHLNGTAEGSIVPTLIWTDPSGSSTIDTRFSVLSHYDAGVRNFSAAMQVPLVPSVVGGRWAMLYTINSSCNLRSVGSFGGNVQASCEVDFAASPSDWQYYSVQSFQN